MRILIIPALFMGLGLLVVLLAGDSLAFPDSIEESQAWLQSFGGFAWAVGAGLIIGDAVLPLPSDATIFTLGFIYGGLLGGFIGGVAATIAGLLGYGIARLLGENGARFLVGEKDLQRARLFYERWGFMAIAIGRAIGGPAEYLVVVAGLTRMPFTKVFAAIVTGAFSAAFCMAFLGAFALTDPLLAMGLAAALVLMLIGCFRFMQKRHIRDTNATANATTTVDVD
jgi:uncharacterized membrane protein YdjX (TVP38/TMEM64 family)